MANGRPAQDGYTTLFNCKEYSANITSMTEMTDASGWQYFTGKINKERRLHG